MSWPGKLKTSTKVTFLLLPVAIALFPAYPVLDREFNSGRSAFAAETIPLSRKDFIFELNRTFQNIAEKVTPTVVSVTSSKPSLNRGKTRGEPVISMGSGVIVSADGHILTSQHVIEDAEEIMVVLSDGRSYQASVIGSDYTTDLAVLKIKLLEPGTRLPAVRFGDSDSCSIGSWVLAVGNPLELGLSITAGIISAKGRKIDILSDNPLNVEGNIDQSIESFIQTDAVINPGNSGGALVNLRGELIGINSAIASQTGLYQGYGFAVPVNLARRVMEDLINLGHVVRPVMGVIIQNLDPVMAKAFGLESPQGVLIEDFIPKKNSPAELGGLERGDVIISVESRPVNFSQQLQEMIAKRRPGETVAVTVIRKGQKFTRRVTLGSKEIGEQKPSSKGKAIQPGKTFIGMGLREITDEDLDELALENKTGLIVDRLDSGGIAERSGLMLGDVLLKINYHPVASLEEANDLLDDVSPGTALLFQILRGGTNRFISLEVP